MLKGSPRFHSRNQQQHNYSTDFIERNTYIRPNDSSNNSYTTTAPTTLQHSSCTQSHLNFLRRLLTNVKGKDKPGAVYKIHCSNCQATYIGETGRNLTRRLSEHKQAIKKGDLNNNIAEHHLKTSHAID